MEIAKAYAHVPKAGAKVAKRPSYWLDRGQVGPFRPPACWQTRPLAPAKLMAALDLNRTHTNMGPDKGFNVVGPAHRSYFGLAEDFVNEVERSAALAFRVSPAHRVEIDDPRLADYFERWNALTQIRPEPLRPSERAEVFLDTLSRQFLFVQLTNPQLELGGKLEAEWFNDLIVGVRCGLKSRSVRRANRRTNLNQKLIKEFGKAFDLLTTHNQLWCTRLVLHYDQPAGACFPLQPDYRAAQNDMRRFLRNVGSKSSIFGSLVGCQWFLAFEEVLGYHYELILMFTTPGQANRPALIAQYWASLVGKTAGHKNRADAKHSYLRCGNGLIDVNQPRTVLKLLVAYRFLFQTSGVEWIGGARTKGFRRSDFRKYP
mgnify:CR=1 FL=1